MARGYWFSRNGFLGLGQRDPKVELDVLGDVSVSGALTVAGSAIAGMTVGAFGSTPNANGASITSGVLTLQPADGTNPGGLSTAAQTIAGGKTFTSAITSANGIDRAGAGTAGVRYVASGHLVLACDTGFSVFIQNAAGTTTFQTDTSQNVSKAGWRCNTTAQSGTSYSVAGADEVVLMSDDAARTATLLSGAAAGAGARITVIDTSGSSTAGHTITVAPTSGTINGAANAVITPGTNKSKTFMSDGTNWFIIAGF